MANSDENAAIAGLGARAPEAFGEDIDGDVGAGQLAIWQEGKDRPPATKCLVSS